MNHRIIKLEGKRRKEKTDKAQVTKIEGNNCSGFAPSIFKLHYPHSSQRHTNVHVQLSLFSFFLFLQCKDVAS